MKKCKLCPRKKVCRDECYGENPCEFAKTYDRLGTRLVSKTVSIQSLRSERDDALKSVPQHKIFGQYVLTPIRNAFNQKTSWWISKAGATLACYCFTSSDPKEVEYQISNALDQYINILERQLRSGV